MTIIIAAVGTISIFIHLVAGQLALQIYVIREILVPDKIARRLCLLALGFFIPYFFALKYLFGIYTQSGTSGVLLTLASLAPTLFDFFNERLAELGAEAFGFCFIPGGILGLIIGTLVSLIVNFFEVKWVLEFLLKLDQLQRWGCVFVFALILFMLSLSFISFTVFDTLAQR